MTHVQKDTAILLKEKGYNAPSRYEYIGSSNILSFDYGDRAYHEDEDCYSAPTLYEATEWLRAKGVHVCVVPVNLWQQWRMFIYIDSYPPQKTRIPNKPMDYPTHDEALEAGIVHALKNYVK